VTRVQLGVSQPSGCGRRCRRLAGSAPPVVAHRVSVADVTLAGGMLYTPAQSYAPAAKLPRWGEIAAIPALKATFSYPRVSLWAVG
jgi:hypothetical protein